MPVGKFTNIVCLNHSLALQSALCQEASHDSQGAKRLPVIPKGFKGLQEACSACFGIQLRKSKNALGFTLSLNKDLG